MYVFWEIIFGPQHKIEFVLDASLLVSTKKVLDISADGWWKYYYPYWMINRKQIYFIHIIIESANSIYDMSQKHIHSLFWDKLYLAANPKYWFSLHRFLFAILAIHSFQTLRTQPYKSEQVQLSSYYKYMYSSIYRKLGDIQDISYLRFFQMTGWFLKSSWPNHEWTYCQKWIYIITWMYVEYTTTKVFEFQGQINFKTIYYSESFNPCMFFEK